MCKIYLIGDMIRDKVLKQNGIEIENDKFARFIQTHNNWLRNSYIIGEQDFILVAKYRKS